MMRQDTIAVAWVVGMLFAPDNLILLGNATGSTGLGIFFLLIFVMSVYWLHSRCYKKIAVPGKGPSGEFERISDFMSPAVAVVFSIAPRFLTAVFLATATLVASGFVFNEVFVHRFPNFAFAFLMLGTLLAINLYSRNLSRIIQIFLSGTAVAGIFVLSLAGIFQGLNTSDTIITTTATALPLLKGSFSLLMLFVGFDLLTFYHNQSDDQTSNLQQHLRLGLLLAGGVFCLWAMASFLHVPAERLSDTTIPHILAAKKIWGQAGRIIMGVVIIAGTGAAVNALFMGVGEMIAELSLKGKLGFLPRYFNRSVTTLILLSLVTAIMMALGVAGTDALDTFVRGSLILWLLNYAALNLTQFSADPHPATHLNKRLSWRQTVSHGAIFILMISGSVILIATDDNVGLLIHYLSIIVFGIGLPVWLGRRMQSRRRGSYDPIGE